MEIQTGALIIVLAYMVGMMIVGYVVGKINIKGSADYLVAGRRMGLFMVAFSCPPTTSAAAPPRAWPRRPSARGASARSGTSWRRPWR